MLISLISLCIVLHSTLHPGTAPEKEQAVNEKLITPPATQTFPSAFFIGLE